ncbi:MAG TPA: S9 family peptidase [Thermoanaerobaculia bacterium]|nr:S9 family peptidase [Thermoanaerobaculia bacterium]
MRRLSLVLFFTAATALAQHPMTFDDLASIHRIGAPQISPDGKTIAYDASTPDLAANTSRSAVFLVPAAGGESTKIADGGGPVWSPDGKTLAYTSKSQAYLYSNNASRKVTDLAGGAGSAKWMPDGSALVVVSDIYPDCGVDPACIKDKTTAAEKRPTQARVITNLLFRHWKAWQEPTRTHIVYVPLNGGASRDLTPGPFDAPPFSIGGGDEFDVSPDGKELVYARDTAEHPEISTNSDLFLVPISGGEARRITTRKGADTSPKYSPDGHWIAWRSQARPGYESDLWELWIYDRASGATRRLASSFDNWIDSITWAPDSRSIYVTAPEKTKNAIYEVDVSDGAAHPLWNDASADGIAVRRSDRTLFFQRSSLTHPNDIYALSRGAAAATQITHDNDALMRTITVSATSDIWYTGAEGAQVQALVVKPPGFDASKKYPALVLIHGGPQGNWADAWSYRWNPQMFAARGYVILMPNARGSTGYGQKFVEEISGDWGGKAYVDIMNGVDKLAAMPFVDGTRIGAAGASFGGYMIDWILGHTDRFKALFSHDGVYNLTSMYGVTEELWFPEWEFRGNPWDNPELYEKWSPHLYAKNFKTPTLVAHGELDFRVPIGEGLQLFTALQRRGVPSKLLYFPDEGHWVLKPQNSKLWYQTVGDWFDQWVK